MSALLVDLIDDILCRLPVKSLLRFRCLSKQFLSLIDDADFIKRHHQNRLLDQTLVVQDTTQNLFSVDSDSADNAFEQEIPFEDWGSDISLVGYCDGLLALSHRHLDIGLWNISTKKHQILPKFWSDFDEGDDFFDGFGYDVATDDYKWVRIIRCYCKPFTEVTVTVYSLKASSGRSIEDFPEYFPYNLLGIGTLVGGALNWVGERDISQSKCRKFIMSFDLKSEEFCEISLPDTTNISGWTPIEVHVLGGCLCVSYLPPDSRSPSVNVFDIWMMKEYQVEDSWTKIYSISDEKLPRSLKFSLACKVLAHSKCGDKVLVFQINGDVVQHDLEKGKIECVINGCPMYILRAIFYVGSLVSPYVSTSSLGGYTEEEKRKTKNASVKDDTELFP